MPTRRIDALETRRNAADTAANRAHPDHNANSDERSQYRYALNFTKGMPHEHGTGVVLDNAAYEQFIRAVDSGDPRDFIDTPLGPPDGFKTAEKTGKVRAWESQGAGLAFDLEGPDAQAVTMPPAPEVGSDELTAEIAEVYGHALLRDQPLSQLRHGSTGTGGRGAAGGGNKVDKVIGSLNTLDWFGNSSIRGLRPEAVARRRDELTLQTAFRGIAPGDDVGPYLSQFLLIGTDNLGMRRDEAEGLIQYGGQTISQKVQQAEPEDFMITWDSWFDVQNGLDNRGTEKYVANDRFITTGRDLATFVHYDALYQAYLNACLILLARDDTPFDPGIPFQADDALDHQQGFAHFGGPHILTLVPEVATRALKAVRYQKFNVHRRLRPEALGGRIEKAGHLRIPRLAKTSDAIADSYIGSTIRKENEAACGVPSLLLPMAFPEGSPMHPSYGAGHATVAGACVTILKAFFDHSRTLSIGGSASTAYVPNDTGSALERVEVYDADGNRSQLTVEGELNKLAANISIGRDWAGVHYFTDYWQSLLMGEQIAIEILREHKLCFNENYSMTIPRFNGTTTRI